MMNDLAIRVERLGKQYQLGGQRERYPTFRDALRRTVMTPLRRVRTLMAGQAATDHGESFWALRDISFDVQQGEVVGIIGRNGAGKSTLLKILSRITEPTEGKATLWGRVGSLLEVGTGFHPELTGRENVYLNGAILGMGRGEIRRKFDEIVAFAEIEKFIDTPVKHYSSGMYVRLAFAVAAHLEPEILVVDEVLSVGDAAFQSKCIGKMKDTAGGGRTVLFVSHNMSAVAQLCERALLLDQGRIARSGDPREVIADYLSSGIEATGIWRPRVRDDCDTQIESLTVTIDGKEPAAIVPYDCPFELQLVYEVRRPLRNAFIYIDLEDDKGTLIFSSWDTDSGENGALHQRPPGLYRSTCRVPAYLLRPGRYVLTFGSHEKRHGPLESNERVLAFDISNVGCSIDLRRPGIIAPLLAWDVQRVREAWGSSRAASSEPDRVMPTPTGD